MSKYKYYVFESMNIGTFDLMSKTVESISNITPYKFNGQEFDCVEDLLCYLNEANAKAAADYKKDFGICPPYTITQCYIDIGNFCCTYITIKGNVLRFTNKWIPQGFMFGGPVADFVKAKKNEPFTLNYLDKLHNVILSSMVFTPYRNDEFLITMPDGKELFGKVHHGAHGYFVNISRHGNEYISTSYHIPRQEIQNILQTPWIGDWPETEDKEIMYKIIDFINNFSNVCYLQNDEIRIKDNTIIYKNCQMYITQLKNGKWYICGKMKTILSMFKAQDMNGIREYVNKVLGKKLRAGVFPECDSREEILELINRLK